MTEKYHSKLKKAGTGLLICLFIFAGIKYIIPIFWPFILAFCLALLVDPVVNRLRTKFSLKRGFASAFVVTLFLFLILGGVTFIAIRLFLSLGEHLKNMPDTLSRITFPSIDIPNRVKRITDALPSELTDIFQDMVNGIRSQTAQLPARMYSRIFDIISNAASKAPTILFSLIMLALALYFFSGGLPYIKCFLIRQLPEKLRSKVDMVKNDVLTTVKAWGKAQLKLMGLCFIELTVTFILLRLNYAVLLAAGIALIDALPIFGIGLVLIPWTAFSFITGNYQRAVFLGLSYALINLARSFIEPRLLGSQTGLHPAATLLTVYAGYRTSGVGGMILFPIALMLLKQFNDRGWIRLWR